MLITKAQYVDVTETEGARVYTFRASTGSVDRQNEVIDQAGWQLDSYRANPVILDSHRYESVYDVIGRSVRTEVVNGALEVDVIFADDDVEELVSKGFLRTVSVGFRSLARRPVTANEPMVHTQMELLEVSLVAIPANRDAVRLRSISEKAGRKLSQSTADCIQQAIDLLQGLLDGTTPDNVPADPMLTDACKPKPKSAEIEPTFYNVNMGVVAALAAFAEEQ